MPDGGARRSCSANNAICEAARPVSALEGTRRRYVGEAMAAAHGNSVEHLTIVFEEAEDGWIAARIAETPAAISQGRSRDEARANVIEALQDLLGFVAARICP